MDFEGVKAWVERIDGLETDVSRVLKEERVVREIEKAEEEAVKA